MSQLSTAPFALYRSLFWGTIMLVLGFVFSYSTVVAVPNVDNDLTMAVEIPSVDTINSKDNENLIYLDTNGITIRCDGADIGFKAMVNGVEYDVVDRALLSTRIAEKADLTRVCTSNVTDMSYLFFDYKDFNQPIGSWDVSNVTNMEYMFYATSFNQPIGDWDVSNVTNMTWMFYTTPFNQPIGDWKVNKVTNMSYMFQSSTFNQPIGGWNVSEVTDMSYMFQSSDFNQPIGGWNVSKVTNMEALFRLGPFNQPIGNWNVGNVTNMALMFDQGFRELSDESIFFNQDISSWDVSKVTNMRSMFQGSDFNQPIGTWDVSSVTDMSQMFYSSRFNQPIGSWNVSNVTSMAAMFSFSQFNQDINAWDVSKVTNMLLMFYYAYSFNQDLNSWNVGSVTNMSAMFRISSFNGNISNWDVSKVINFEEMFESSPFNQDISNWNVSNATKMTRMFSQNTAFNQPLQFWCVTKIGGTPSDFSTSSLLPQNKPVWGTCPTRNASPVPMITSISKTFGIPGQTLDLTLSGTGFVSGYTWVSFGNGIKINAFSVTSETAATANITIDQTATTGTRDVSVTNPEPDGGKSTLVGGFTVSNDPVIELNPTTVNAPFSTTSEDVSVSFAGSGSPSWTAVSSHDWLTISPSSGTGNATIVATISKNPTFDARSATITITATGALNSPATVTVNQEKKPFVYFDDNGITLRCEGAEIDLRETINGVEYWVINNSKLYQLVGQGYDLSKVCTSNITDMNTLFLNRQNENRDIRSWDVSNVTNMAGMFEGSSFDQEIGVWNVGKVTNMNYMFKNTPFNRDIADWNVSNVTNMAYMFEGSSFNWDIDKWDVSKVTTMAGMFLGSQFNSDISKWDVSNVEDMTRMFSRSPFDKPIGNWDVSKVTTMAEMFYQGPRSLDIPTSYFNQDINEWDVRMVTTMRNMFYGADFNQPLHKWNVSNVTDMGQMFFFSRFNQDIGKWKVSNVTNMSAMFCDSPFNQPIGNWDVSNVTNMLLLFGGTPFNQDISDWDVSNVTNMQGMFAYSAFNQDISNWDVSNVEIMGGMFQVSEFNQNISNWDVSNVSVMRLMFHENRVFNQPLNLWCVNNFTSEPELFSGRILLEQNKPVWGTCPTRISTPVPTIVSLSPAVGGVGKTTDVTITGTGFVPSYTWVSFGDNIEIKQFSVVSETQATAMINIPAGISAGTRDVTVKNPAPGGGKNTRINGFTISTGPSLTLSPTTISASPEIDSKNVSISFSDSENLSWTATSSEDWLTVNPSSGTGNATIVATVTKNPSTSIRSATITVTATDAGNSPATVAVQQAGRIPVIYLDPNGITIRCEGMAGDKALVGGIEYEVVDNVLLVTRRNEKADLTRVCTSLVTDMSNLFAGTTDFNQTIGSWDVSNVTNMSAMFDGSIFNQDISNWDVGKVTSMSSMFNGSSFNQPIGDWEVRNVTNMNGMFGGSSFNQPINLWCVPNIPSEPVDFSSTFLSTENKPKWGTCPNRIPTPSPLLTLISPAFGYQGQTLAVIITGNGFVPDLTSINYGTGIQVSNFTVISETQATANITIAITAALGPRDVSVINPAPGGGTATLSAGITITAAPTLSVTPTTISKSASAGVLNVSIVNSGTGQLSWTAASDQGWVTLGASSGTGTATLAVNFAENTSVDARSATITITPADELNSPILITVNQAGKEQAPVVTTSAASNITNNSAQLGGSVALLGSSTVDVRGVCFATTPAPTTNDTCVNAATSEAGMFVVTVTNLNAGTLYYVRAYAINPAATVYGDEVTFTTTTPTPTLKSLTPNFADRGQTLSIIVTGTGFVPEKTTLSMGADIQVTSLTIMSDTQATASITIVGSAATGSRSVSVTNPAPGGGTATLESAFTVNLPPAPALSVTPVVISKSAAESTESIAITNAGTGTLSWTALSSQSWLTLSSASGAQNTTMTATLAANTAFESRSATIIVTADGAANSPFTINVSQAGFVQAPVVDTSPVMNITSSTALLGGDVTSQGSSPITARGICYATTPSPTIANTCASITPASIGSFTVTVTNLTPSTLYYVRAYAISAAGTSYGQNVSFNTPLPNPTLSTLTPTVGIQGQLLSVNVNGSGFIAGSTSISFGDGIQVVSLVVNSSVSATASLQIGATAATGARNVSVTNPAPGGGTATLTGAFTVNPPPAPVLSVTPATSSKTAAAAIETISITNTGTGTLVWTAVSNQPWVTLSATSGTGNATITATIAENTAFTSRSATIIVTAPSAASSPRSISVSQAGRIQAPVLTTAAATNITSSSAQLGGAVTSQGSATVTVRGVCFAKTPTPTTADTCVNAEVAGLGAFTVGASNLSASTLYHARAFATSTAGTAYGQSIQFTTLAPNNPVPFVTAVLPAMGAQGSAVDVTITGNSFAETGVSVEAGEGVAVSNITRTSANTITARFTIVADASVGSRVVAVTNPPPAGGTSTNLIFFTVTLPTPIPNAANWNLTTIKQTPLRPIFDWGGVSGASNYTVQYSNRIDFPQVTSCAENCTETNASPFTNTHQVVGTSFQVPTVLEVGTTHYWRVRANTSTVTGIWSASYPFVVVGAPSVPVLVSPFNGATGLTGSVQLSWTPTTGTTRYQLEVSPNVNFTNVIAGADNLTGSSFTMPPFTSQSPVDYFWRVRSIGIGGNSPWSNVYFYRRAALTSDGGDLSELPADFELLQNYPNPFNPSTNIAFSLPTSAHVTLTVHSILGQEVAVLVNKTMVGGRHVVTFDASKLSSGVYLYRLTAGEFTQTRVMNLVK